MNDYYSYDYNDDIDIDSSSSESSVEDQRIQQPEPSPPRKVTLVIPTKQPEPEPEPVELSPPPSPKPDYSSSKKKRKSLFFSPAYNAGRPRTKGPKLSRPVKLKPLKEVLTKLIAQIKKKDDYAFFLTPVDPADVPGYTELIKHPMDFGTMSTKVSKGKYRSLEEFADDFNLVVSNAKIFNPPGTIHHTEAARIEAWGLDQIQKSSTTVIQYEADWNIEIERDDMDEDMLDTPMEDVVPETPIEGSNGRSPSVISFSGASRRPRNSVTVPVPVKKEVSESLEPNGRMPGAKDGIGVFPPGSDLAQTMLALKLRKKRHITKKERLRIEKAGRPYSADGSFQYTDLDDPFSILSVFIPEPPSKPRLTPVLPPPSTSVLLPPSYLDKIPEPRPPTKHWSISRISTKKKDVEEPTEPAPPPESAREHNTLNYGSFAVLAAALEDEMKKRENGAPPQPPKAPKDDSKKLRKAESELYLQNVVYGGLVGVSYVRSLAEFLKRPTELGPGPTSKHPELGLPLPHYIEREVVDPQTFKQHLWLRGAAANLQLTTSSNAPLSQYLSKSLMLAEIRGPIDLGLLMKAQDELVEAESEKAVEDVLKETAEALSALVDKEGKEEEMRTLRMSFLALAKKIPIDHIAGGDTIVSKKA